MEISEIKTSLPILDILKHYNLKADKNNRVLCPFHDDKTPSLQIYPQTNTWTCFSSNCSAASGDQIEMIQRLEKSDKHTAIMKAKSMLGVSTALPLLDNGEELSRVTVMTKLFSLQKLRRHGQVIEAIDYLEARGFNTNLLEVGFVAHRTEKNWQRKPDWYKQTQKYKLRRFRECVIFPLRDEEGQIISVYGRKAIESKSQDIGKHYYLSGPHQGLYPRWPEVQATSLILTESVIDAASLSFAMDEKQGQHILALYGTNGLTADHKAVIRRCKHLKEITLFMDGDEAGRKGAQEVCDILKSIKEDCTIYNVNTPDGEDINSLFQKGKHDKINRLIEQRSMIYSSSMEFSNEEEKVETVAQTGRLYTENEEMLLYRNGVLNIVVLGGIKLTGLDKLRVTLKIECINTSSRLPLRESLDLYNARQIDLLIKRMCEQLDMTSTEASQSIGHLTSHLELYRNERLSIHETKKEQSYQMSKREREQAMNYLKSPKLMERTMKDISASGIVGEYTNAMIGHVVYLSRKRHKPLHVMYLGKSGSGKTYLQEKLSELIPAEDKKSVTALSDQSLYYQGKKLQHKVLFIEDIDGVENVLYMIRELQSKGSINKTVVWKDTKGNMQSVDVTAHGPVCISSCTTREKVYEDNANRCILLYIDDSEAQDERIMVYQRMSSAGKTNPYEQRQIKLLHQNIQRVLRPIKVINPYAELIVLPKSVFRPRRSLQLLLGFIETVTFYHQYQRSVSTDNQTGEQFICSTYEDIQISIDLLRDVLFNKSDELTKACRKFLEKLKKIIPQGEVFYTQDIRKQLRLPSTTVHRYVRMLKANGYLQYKGGSRNRGYEYEISDYQEYEVLRDVIDEKLTQILENIKKSGGIPQVFQNENGMNKSLNSKVVA